MADTASRKGGSKNHRGGGGAAPKNEMPPLLKLTGLQMDRDGYLLLDEAAPRSGGAFSAKSILPLALPQSSQYFSKTIAPPW